MAGKATTQEVAEEQIFELNVNLKPFSVRNAMAIRRSEREMRSIVSQPADALMQPLYYGLVKA